MAVVVYYRAVDNGKQTQIYDLYPFSVNVVIFKFFITNSCTC